jgi:very-short-patch-repair endonuclease
MKRIHNINDLRLARRNLRKQSTPEEYLLWSQLRDRQLGYKFRRQHSIGPYIVDFYCPTHRLIVEIDGNQHYQDEDKLYDVERTKFLNDLGYIVIRFNNYLIRNNINSVINDIRSKFPTP